MPSWPTALGGMFAAGYAATQAQKVGIDSPTALVANALKTLGTDSGTLGGYTPPPSATSSSTGELVVLQGEVDRLHKLLADVVKGQKGGAGYTVIHTGRGGWSVYVLPIALAGGVYLYVKVRGWAITDFFMVTNKSLQQFRDLVSNSMTHLWEELRKQKDEFLARISDVRQQQQQMDERLQNVSRNVEDIRDVSNNIESRVGQMDHKINIMSTHVQRASEGITLLCAAVADVTRRVGMDNSRLKTYVQATPPEITDNNPGLRTLLSGHPSGEQSVGAISASTSIANPGLITDVTDLPEAVELPPLLQSGADSALAALGARGGNAAASRAGPLPDDMKVLYRRDSVASASSARTLLGGIFMGGGAANTSANRSRSVANLH